MIINLNAVLGLQVRKVQSHRPLKMSTLVSSHFLWEKSFAKKISGSTIMGATLCL